MTDPDNGLPSGLMEHLRRIVVHGLGVLRCYITMLAAESERRCRRVLAQAMWVLMLAGIGAAGVSLFALGAARWLENRLAVPGAGAMIIGIALMAVFLAIALIRALRKERDS